MLVSSFFFSLLLVVVSSFSFRQVGYTASDLAALTPGILIVTFLFSGMVILHYSFSVEYENHALQGVMLSKASPGSIYFSKLVTNFLCFSVLQFFVLLSHSLFFGAELWPAFVELMQLSMLFGLGFISLGTLLSSMSVSSKSKEILLPIILFPLLIPLAAAFVFLARELLTDGALGYGGFWFSLLVVFNVIALVLSLYLFEFVVGE